MIYINGFVNNVEWAKMPDLQNYRAIKNSILIPLCINCYKFCPSTYLLHPSDN